MKKSINTLLKHSSFSKINRSANPAVVRASTILFDSMQELKAHEKKILKNQDLKLDDGLDEKFLFEDVLTFDEQPKDSVRLSAATIEELFKSTDYNLEDVRKNKLVKPISL